MEHHFPGHGHGHGHGHEGEIPIPITSSFVVHHHHHHTNITNNSLSPINTSTEDNKKALVVAAGTPKAVRYRECLKNYAASMGGTATDGCGEFMPNGEEGSLEALKCSACGCHRNFHRKESEGELPSCCCCCCCCYYKASSRNSATFHGFMPRQQPPALIMPLGAIHTSESDEMDDGYGGYRGGGGPTMGVKKRFRTKFTAEQKEKMLGFAERVGWKLQRQEEGAVLHFCQEIGVKRRVLKVWMHNNKHKLARKTSTTSANSTISTPPQIQ